MAQRADAVSYPSHLVAGVVFPVVAAVAAHVLAPLLPLVPAATNIVVILVLGYFPTAILWGGRIWASGRFPTPATVEEMAESIRSLDARPGGSVVLAGGLDLSRAVGASLVPEVWARSARRERRSYKRKRAFGTLFIALGLMFGSQIFVIVLTVVMVLLFFPFLLAMGALAHFTEGTPWLEPPTTWAYPIQWIIFVVVVLVTLSDNTLSVLQRPRTGIAEVLVGLRVNAEKILELVASFGIAAIVVGYVRWGLFGELGVALVAATASGVLLGIATYRVGQDAEWSLLVALGRARCDLRLGRKAAGRWRVAHQRKLPGQVSPKCAGKLGHVLWLLLEGPVLDLSYLRPRRLPQKPLDTYLEDAAQSVAHAARYRPEWRLSLEATRRLVGEAQERELQEREMADNDETLAALREAGRRRSGW